MIVQPVLALGDHEAGAEDTEVSQLERGVEIGSAREWSVPALITGSRGEHSQVRGCYEGRQGDLTDRAPACGRDAGGPPPRWGARFESPFVIERELKEVEIAEEEHSPKYDRK